MKKFLMLCTLTAASLTGLQAQQTQVIAHRGFWDTAGSAQNSIAALEKAAEAKVYGSEFDVQLTKDNVVVVNHDSSINGYIIADTPYSKLKTLKLKNGENLPSLEAYLDKGKTLPDIQLILEIKPHKTKEQEDIIVQKVVEMVKQRGMEKQVEYISFSLYVCEQLVKLTPGSQIAYLEGDLSPEEVKAKGMTGIDYAYKVFRKHPEWVKQAHDLGLSTNVWTVNGEKKLKKMIDLKVDYITTNQPLLATELINGQK